MNLIFLLRLFLDLVAAGLLVAGLAYWWLGNTAHELIGTAMFLLIIVHNGFNRRWYGRIARDRKQSRGRITIALNLMLFAVMAALLVTSVLLSRTAFGFIPFDGGITVREAHLLAAYWAVVLVGIHVGLNWHIVMNVLRGAFGINKHSALRTGMLRLAAFAIAVKGVLSSSEMMLGSKLFRQPALDMWDFGEATPEFFANYASIIGLYAFAGHYGSKLVRRRPREAASSTVRQS